MKARTEYILKTSDYAKRGLSCRMTAVFCNVDAGLRIFQTFVRGFTVQNITTKGFTEPSNL